MQRKTFTTLQADLLLLLVACIWGFGFVAQRAGMEHIGPYTFNGIRFVLGALCLVPLSRYIQRQARRKPQDAKKQESDQNAISPLKAGCIAGVFLFLGATLQQVGLQYTTAGKAGFITGLYVVFVPILGLFWKQKTTSGTWIGAGLASLGLYFLSVNEAMQLAPGDFLELCGALFWACHVLLLGYLAPRTSTVCLAKYQFMVCGLLSLVIALGTEIISLQGIIEAAIPLLYGGVISVGAGYTLQVIVQRAAHPAHAAILLSLESPFAALGGWIFLQELLSLRGAFGCGLMLAGMLLSQLWEMRKERFYGD